MKTQPVLQKFTLTGLFIIAMGAVLQIAAPVLVPFAIAAFITAMVYPMVISLQRHKIPILLAVLLIFMSVLFSFTAVGYLIYLNLATLMTVLPDRLTELLSKLYWVTSFLETHNINLDYETLFEHINVSKITNWVGNASGSFLSFIGSTFLITLFSMLMIFESSSIQTRLKKAFPNEKWLANALAKISSQIKEYMIAKTAINAVAGFLTWLVCWAVGVDTPILWGILAFLLSYIPTLGPILAVALPSLLALIQFDQMSPIIIIFVLLVLIHGVIANVAEPKLYGASLQLSPLMIIISLIFWAWTWGIAGAFLSIPILAASKIILNQFKATQPYAILLGQ
jgi:AI-2 transport protein TqsA